MDCFQRSESRSTENKQHRKFVTMPPWRKLLSSCMPCHGRKALITHVLDCLRGRIASIRSSHFIRLHECLSAAQGISKFLGEQAIRNDMNEVQNSTKRVFINNQPRASMSRESSRLDTSLSRQYARRHANAACLSSSDHVNRVILPSTRAFSCVRE